MKLLGIVLGFEVGDENDLNSKMETDSGVSSTKKETNTSSTSTPKPTTTSEKNKNSTPQLTPVRKYDLWFFDVCLLNSGGSRKRKRK